MIYWLLISLLILAVIVVSSYTKKRSAEMKKLAEIKEQWGKPKADSRNFNLISSYLTATGGDFAASSADLDLDDVFTFIDRAASKPGQQYLFKKLHTPQVSESYFSALEARVERINSDPQLRELTQLKLSELNDSNAYYLPGLFTQKHQSLFAPLVKFYIGIAAPLIIGLITGLVIAPNQVYFLLLLAVIIINFVIHYSNKTKMLSYTHSLPQLLLLIKVNKWLFDKGLLGQNEIIKQSLAKVDKLKKSLNFINLQRIATDSTDIVFLFTEWIKIIFLLEPLNFIRSIHHVNQYPVEIRLLFDCVGEVDMAISIQSVRDGLDQYCKPEFVERGDQIMIRDLYHPLIDNCVTNSITIENRQGVLITGSNMSGKTTFIRAIAINALLSQTINTSFAAQYKAPPLNIFTSINMSDDLGEHKSYFQAEATSVRNIIRGTAAGKPLNSLVIIDEIFRGTNTIERIAAAKAVLSYFVDDKNFVLVSTHDLELAELLGNDYKVFSFEELSGDDRLVFDYKIKEGLLKNKNGIAVLKGLDYPQYIIDEAYKISTQLRDKYDL